MIRSILFPLIATACLLEPAPAQHSGVVTYEITRRMEGGKIRIIRADGAGNWTESSGGEDGAPIVINLKQEVLFSPGLGRIKSPMPAGMPIPAGAEMKVMRPFEEQIFVDFNNSRLLKYLQAGMGQDSVVYFTEEAFESASQWEASKKTKEILGYDCIKADVIWKDGKYSVWYTEALGLTFSPVNGLMPANGFVLAIEGDDMAYEAKNIDFREVDPVELLPPGPAREVDEDGYQAAKDRMVEKMGEGGGFKMLRH